MRVLLFGDSITQGFWDTEGGWAARLRKHYDIKGISDGSYDHPSIFNLGISGETSTDLLKRLQNEIEARQWPGEELCIIIAIGTNDNLFESSKQQTSPDDFRQNIMQLCEVAGRFSSKVILFGSNAVDEKLTVPVSWGDFNYTNEEISRYEQITKEVLENQSAIFVPLFDAFKGQPNYEGLLQDGLHPNDKGHELMFQIIQPELDKLID